MKEYNGGKVCMLEGKKSIVHVTGEIKTSVDLPFKISADDDGYYLSWHACTLSRIMYSRKSEKSDIREFTEEEKEIAYKLHFMINRFPVALMANTNDDFYKKV